MDPVTVYVTLGSSAEVPAVVICNLALEPAVFEVLEMVAVVVPPLLDLVTSKSPANTDTEFTDGVIRNAGDPVKDAPA